MSIHLGPKLDTTGLLFYVDAANTRSYPGSGTTVTNIGSGGIAPTLVDGPTFNSANGGYWSFDGTNDRIHAVANDTLRWTQNGSVGLTALTVEMWVKSSDTSGRMLTYAWNGSGQYNYELGPDAWAVQCGSSSSSSISFGRNLSNNTWTHIVCWVNTTNRGYYLNGTEYSGSGAHSNTGGAASLGSANTTICMMSLYPYSPGWGGDTNHAIAGSLALVRIYNRVLTQAEAVISFNSTRKRFGV